MKKLILSLFTVALAMSLTANAEQVTRTISASSGSFTGTGMVWAQVWTSSDTDPAVVLRSDRNNMKVSDNGVGLDLREGSAKTSAYTLSATGSWRITGFDMTFRSNDAANPVTVTCGGRTLTSLATEDTRLTVTDLSEYESAGFTLTGNNQGISTTDFTVTLTSIEPDEYELTDIDMSMGEFTLGTSGQWSSIWSTTKPGSPILYFTSENSNGGAAANMQPAANSTGLDLREGAAKTSVYRISNAGSWRISGFELSFMGNDADNPVTVSAGGQSVTSSATEERTLTVDYLEYGAKASFTLSGNNKGITTTAFKVHVTPMTPTERGVTVFYYTGSRPYSTVYRIPVVAHIPAGNHAGRLIAVNDFRPCGSDIGYGEVDLHTSVSDDLGLNWTIPADPVDADGNHVADGDGVGTPATSNQNRDCGFGDPSLVADRETGELLMMGVCGRVPISQATRAIPQGLAIWWSKDGGDTWTQWKDITEDILGLLDDNCQYGKVDGLFFTAGRMVQSKYVKVGSHYRVYVVGGGRSASIPDTQCWVFYTDDFGQSWHILGDPYKPALTTGGSEPKCEELPDGSVLYSGRAAGGRSFNVFTYTDYKTASGSWDSAVFGKMVTGAASCNGDALILPVKNTETGAAAYLLMQSIPQNPSSRVNVGINWKVLEQGYTDFGSANAVANNWDGSFQATAFPSAYSSLTAMPDGKIGFIYEESTYGVDYCEVFRTLTAEQLTSGVWTYAPDSDLSVALALTRQLVEGKLADAERKYSQRKELLATLQEAADAFLAEPSEQAYLYFNAALNAVKTNTPLSALTSIAAESDADTQLYDLTGRKVTNPEAGHIYISSDHRKIINK